MEGEEGNPKRESAPEPERKAGGCPIPRMQQRQRISCGNTTRTNVVTVLTLQLRDCGITKGTTIYLVAMAAADLLVLIFYVVINRILVPRYGHLFYYHTIVCRLQLIMMAAVIDCSVWLTVSFTFDRFVAVCFQGFKRRYCTAKIAALAVSTVYLLTYARNIPYYFTVLPYIIYKGRQIGCLTNPAIHFVPAWRVFYVLHTILTPLLPYVTVVIFNLLTIRYIIVASRVRRGFRSGGTSQDPQMRNRKRAMGFLFAASASFIFLWMSTVGLFLFSRITNTYTYRDFNDPFAIVNDMSRMLRVLNCCSSSFMYALTQSKFRGELKKLGRSCTEIICKQTAVTK